MVEVLEDEEDLDAAADVGFVMEAVVEARVEAAMGDAAFSRTSGSLDSRIFDEDVE